MSRRLLRLRQCKSSWQGHCEEQRVVRLALVAIIRCAARRCLPSARAEPGANGIYVPFGENEKFGLWQHRTLLYIARGGKWIATGWTKV